MNKHLILENKIGAVIFGLLAIGGIYGLCVGNAIHLFTLGVCSLMSWVLWRETKELNH